MAALLGNDMHQIGLSHARRSARCWCCMYGGRISSPHPFAWLLSRCACAHCLPTPFPHLRPCAVQARVAVLFTNGAFAAFDLDWQGDLVATHASGAAAAARIGRVTDVAWLPLPGAVGA